MAIMFVSGLLKLMFVFLANSPLPLSTNKPIVCFWLRPAGCSAPKSPGIQLCHHGSLSLSGCSGLASQAHLPAELILLHSEVESIPSGDPRLQRMAIPREQDIQMWASVCIDGWSPWWEWLFHMPLLALCVTCSLTSQQRDMDWLASCPTTGRKPVAHSYLTKDPYLTQAFHKLCASVDLQVPTQPIKNKI